MGFFTWLGRGAEKERAYARLSGWQQEYGAYGDRVIKLSARTELARKSAGSTKQAFEFVDRAFTQATQEYARIGELISGIEAGLAQGRIGDFGAVDRALQGLAGKFDELERNLAAWEAKWQAVPLQMEDARRSLARLREEAERTAAVLGAPLPTAARLSAMEQHLARTQETLAGGNPVEAGHLVDDLRIAMGKASEELSAYSSGVSAIAQIEQEVQAGRNRLSEGGGNAPADAVAAVAAAEALLPRLRPSLAAGKLEQFQQELLQIQKELRRQAT